MATDEDIEEIKQRKKAELADRAGTESPDEPVHVDGADHLDELVESGGVVLADFHADWCGPCKMLAPIVETLAADTDATVAKVDVDANQQLAARFNVQSVPTLVLFADGQQVEQLIGVHDESDLRTLIERHA